MSSSNKQQDNNQPKVIGHYLLGKNIGEGTFGKVKLGTHTLTQEKVAIKILEKSRIVDQSDIERVAREIHILKQLRHPNIIQLYEIIETPQQLYLIMEYANGGELFEYIVANSRVSEKESCKYIQQILGGIEYLHKLGIAHRDLKPENLLLDENKNIKIVDFGLSNTYKEGETLKTACGSPCYAAPEMIAGKRYNGLQVDIWSTGVILFALICGYLPFEDASTSALYKKIMAGQYEIPNFVPAFSRDLISKILVTDPQKRYTVKQIKQSSFYQLQQEVVTTGILVGKNAIPIDERILRMLKEYNIDKEQAIKCLEINKHNNITTTYYLLQAKYKNTMASRQILQTQQQLQAQAQAQTQNQQQQQYQQQYDQYQQNKKEKESRVDQLKQVDNIINQLKSKQTTQTNTTTNSNVTTNTNTTIQNQPNNNNNNNIDLIQQKLNRHQEERYDRNISPNQVGNKTNSINQNQRVPNQQQPQRAENIRFYEPSASPMRTAGISSPTHLNTKIQKIINNDISLNQNKNTYLNPQICESPKRVQNSNANSNSKYNNNYDFKNLVTKSLNVNNTQALKNNFIQKQQEILASNVNKNINNNNNNNFSQNNTNNSSSINKKPQSQNYQYGKYNNNTSNIVQASAKCSPSPKSKKSYINKFDQQRNSVDISNMNGYKFGQQMSQNNYSDNPEKLYQKQSYRVQTVNDIQNKSYNYNLNNSQHQENKNNDIQNSHITVNTNDINNIQNQNQQNSNSNNNNYVSIQLSQDKQQLKVIEEKNINQFQQDHILKQQNQNYVQQSQYQSDNSFVMQNQQSVNGQIISKYNNQYSNSVKTNVTPRQLQQQQIQEQQKHLNNVNQQQQQPYYNLNNKRPSLVNQEKGINISTNSGSNYNTISNNNYNVQNINSYRQQNSQNKYTNNDNQNLQNEKINSYNKENNPVNKNAYGFSDNNMKVHKGPFNLRCLSSKNPSILYNDIIKSLQLNNLPYTQNPEKFEVKCETDQLKFDIQLQIVQGVEKMYLVNFLKYRGEINQYLEMSNNVLKSMQM